MPMLVYSNLFARLAASLYGAVPVVTATGGLKDSIRGGGCLVDRLSA